MLLHSAYIIQKRMQNAQKAQKTRTFYRHKAKLLFGNDLEQLTAPNYFIRTVSVSRDSQLRWLKYAANDTSITRNEDYIFVAIDNCVECVNINNFIRFFPKLNN